MPLPGVKKSKALDTLAEDRLKCEKHDCNNFAHTKDGLCRRHGEFTRSGSKSVCATPGCKARPKLVGGHCWTHMSEEARVPYACTWPECKSQIWKHALCGMHTKNNCIQQDCANNAKLEGFCDEHADQRVAGPRGNKRLKLR